MEEWKEYTIDDICKTIFAGGDAVKHNPTKNKTEENNIPIYANSVENEGLYGYCSKPLVTEPAVTVAARGAGTGFVCYRKYPYVPIVRLLTLIPDENVDAHFLYYRLKKNFIKGDGSAIPQLTVPMIKKERITLPSFPTQQKIANILSSLDDKIEVNRRINEQLEELAQALFKSWFVDFEPFKDGEFVESELGMIPKGWKVDYIANIPHVIETGKRPKGGVGNISNGIPSIGAENIKGLGYYDYSKTKFVTEDFANKMKKGEIKGYELLIYKDGGKPGYFIPNFSIFGEGFPFERMYLNEHVFKLDFYNRGFNAFSYFYFKTDLVMSYLNAQGGKAAIPGINQKDVENIPIFTIDNEYVKLFCEKVIPIIEKILLNSKEIHHLTTLRDTLLPKLMSGEIDVDEVKI